MTPLWLVADLFVDEIPDSNTSFAPLAWENQALCTISRR